MARSSTAVSTSHRTALLPGRSFLVGGNGWETKAMPPNVRHRGHVYTTEHNAFNCTPLAVLNVARDSMAHIGFSPATRVFEAAGAAAGRAPDAVGHPDAPGPPTRARDRARREASSVSAAQRPEPSSRNPAAGTQRQERPMSGGV